MVVQTRPRADGESRGRLNLYLDGKTLDRIRRVAEDRGVSESGAARELIRERLDEVQGAA